MRNDPEWLAWKEEDEKRIDEMLEDYKKCKRLNTKFMLDIVLANASSDLFRRGTELKSLHPEIDKVSEKVKLFESKIWFPLLQKYIQEAKYKGHSGCTEKTKILVWACLDRVMITLRDKNDEDVDVTFMVAEDADRPNMGLHAISATAEEATSLLDDAIENWTSLEVNKNVSMI